jgi:queuine tRNA-ribosyltransferase
MEAEFSFQVLNTSPISRARRGRLYTPHAVIETPVFMPVGTQATVKTLSQEEVAQLGFQIILGNTYHLYLRPGDERIARLGGLHRFMRWERAILTDSGGFRCSASPNYARLTTMA